MDKNATLESIQKARAAHESQMKKIEALLNGEKVNNPTAVLKTECSFGRWLYDKDSNLERVLGALFYNNIETIHARWHSEYSRLFNVFFIKAEKKSFFSKLMGSSKADGMDIDKGKLYYSELKSTTKELLKVLAVCERRIQALNESKFL